MSWKECGTELLWPNMKYFPCAFACSWGIPL